MSIRFAVVLTIIGALGSVTPADAQDCQQALAQQDAALRQFDADVRRVGVDFMLDDVRHSALAAVNKRLQGDPTAEAAREIKARWDEYQAYVNQGNTFLTVASDLSRCLRGGTSGCMEQIKQAVQRETEANRLASRIGEAVQKWIDSLGNEAISRAAERVDRTRGILENFTNRAATIATQAASQGIDSCLRDFDRRVQQTQNNATPVSARQPQPPPTAATPKKGMSAGKLTALVVVPAAVATGLYAKNAIDQASNPDGGNGSSSSDPSQIRLVNNPVTIRCSAISGSIQSLCTADIVLDVGNVFAAGSQACIRTDPTGAFFDCQVKGSSSQIAFRIEIRSVCQATLQTGIFVYRDSPNGVAAIARVSAAIPVTCN